jgi:hypothetical protein
MKFCLVIFFILFYPIMVGWIYMHQCVSMFRNAPLFALPKINRNSSVRVCRHSAPVRLIGAFMIHRHGASLVMTPTCLYSLKELNNLFYFYC